jgi:hypothetical protein
MRNFRKLHLFFSLFGTLLLSGCATVKIGRILDEPNRYQNRMVRVDGTVDRSYGAFVTGVYQVQDNTGKIYVVSNNGVPRTGTRITVKGRVMSGITVGSRSFGTTIQEQKHHVYY